MSKFNRNFWEQRYREKTTGWDIGSPSTPLRTYIDQLADKDMKILIPGAGNAYEAEYLYQQGFSQVHVLDLAAAPLENFSKRVSGFPADKLMQGDFFAHSTDYDLILEQTFFCSLDPSLRADYARKMHELLKPKGKLAGLLFDFELTDEGPPFGGSEQEYLGLFEPYFTIRVLEPANNSIKPRQGKELFIIMEKTNN